MKRSFERLVSGLLVAAMLVGLPVVSMASEWDTGDVDTYSAIEVNPVCNHNTDESNPNLKVKVVAPTCTKAGYTQFECKLCGQKYKGNFVAMLGHNYNDGVDKNGKRYYTCQRSGCTENYAVPLGDNGEPLHYHYDSVDGDSTLTAHNVLPSCKDSADSYGYTFYTDDSCGYVQYDPASFKEPLAHDFTEWQFVKESSMLNKGKASRTCRVCGFVETVKTANEEPYAKMGRITKDMTPVYDGPKSDDVVLYLAKGVTFDFANNMYGDRYEVTSFNDVYGNSYTGTFYVQMKYVEQDPSSVPVYSSEKGVQEVATVKSNSRLSVYGGHTTDSALLSTLTKGDKIYIYRYEADQTWGRIASDTNKWVQLNDSDLTRVPAFGFGSELSDLADPDPDTPDVVDVGTVTAASSTIVRNESNVSVGKLPKGTKINFYKSTESGKPFEKDSKGVITRGYIEESEAIRLGLNGAGYIDMTYVTLKSGSKTSGSGNNNSSSNSNSGKTVIATGVVTSSVNLNVRKNPEVSVLNLLGSLPTGTKMEFYEISTHNGASWGKIKYNGQDGWVCMTYVQITSGNSTSIGSSNSEAKPNGTVANCSVGVNVRDTNSVQGKLLTTIAVNSRVAITKLKDGWGFVDGKGWVYMQYIKLDAGAEEAIKNGSNSNNNNNSNKTDNTVKTYTNVTALGEVVSGGTATIYPTTVAKPGTEQLTMMGGRQFTITDRTIVNGTVWYKTSAGGYTGWVADDGNITLPAIVGTVNVSSLNVYADRSTDSKVISTLVQNAQVTIEKNGQWTDGIYVWGKVKNTNGYVQMNNLKLVVQQTTDGISVGSTAITGKVLRTLDVRKTPKEDATILYELQAKHTVTIDTWCYKAGIVWAKVTVGEESGWIQLNNDNVGQSTVSATVNVDKIELYTAAGDLSSRTTLTKRKNDKVTVLERTLVDETSVWGRIEVSGDDYWMNLAGTSLGTYSIVPTETTAPATTAPSNNGNNNSNNGTTTAVKGTICNTDSVNVRTGAGVSNALATTLTRGTVVTVYEQKTVDNALWGRIDQGWVAMSYVDLSAKTNTGNNSTVSSGTLSGNTILTTVPSDAIAVGFVNTKNLNVRNGSGFGYTTTATLPQYTNVVVYEQILKDGVIWARIDQGWVCATYLTYTGLSVTGSGTAGTVARCFYTARVRANPGVNSALVGYVMVNSRLEVYEQQSYSGEMWGRTSIGWISMQYVLTDGSLPA